MPRLRGSPLHDVRLLGIDAERERRRTVGDQVDPQELRREQRQEQPDIIGRDEAEQACEHHAREHREQFAGIRRQQIDQVFADVVVDAAAFLDGLDDAGEIVVGQHHVGGLLGDIGAGDAHGDADIGGLECGRIVDAVAGHGDDVALALQRAHDAQLVLGIDAGEHAHLLDDRIELGIRPSCATRCRSPAALPARRCPARGRSPRPSRDDRR